MVEEGALGDAGRLAELVDRGGGEALAADHRPWRRRGAWCGRPCSAGMRSIPPVAIDHTDRLVCMSTRNWTGGGLRPRAVSAGCGSATIQRKIGRLRRDGSRCAGSGAGSGRGSTRPVSAKPAPAERRRRRRRSGRDQPAKSIARPSRSSRPCEGGWSRTSPGGRRRRPSSPAPRSLQRMHDRDDEPSVAGGSPGAARRAAASTSSTSISTL